MQKWLEDIINDALWAPTPDNMQFWQFEVTPYGFHVAVDKTKNKHPLDPYCHTAILSLGGLYEYIRIAAAHRGYDARIQYRSADHFSLEIRLLPLAPGAQNLAELHPFLRERRTDRRAYKEAPIAPHIVQEISATNAQYSSLVQFCADPGEQFYNYLRTVEKLFWRETDGIAETLNWINFSHQPQATGFHYSNAGLNWMESKLIGLLRHHPALLRILFRFGGSWMNAQKYFQTYKKSAGFLLFGARDVSEQSLFEVGRQAIYSWLTLTKHGLVAQPLSFSSFNCYEARLVEDPIPFIEKNETVFSDGLNILRKAFAMDAGLYPCWLMRVGESKPMSKLMTPSRLSVEEVLVPHNAHDTSVAALHMT